MPCAEACHVDIVHHIRLVQRREELWLVHPGRERVAALEREGKRVRLGEGGDGAGIHLRSFRMQAVVGDEAVVRSLHRLRRKRVFRVFALCESVQEATQATQENP